MQTIDKMADQLLLTIDKLYHSKELTESDQIKRCSSMVLERGHKVTKSTFETSVMNKSMMGEIVTMKLDLTFPKIINSKIVSEATALNRILNRRVKKYQLVYRASDHGFSIAQFYHTMQATHNHMS